jgi:para-nitrobenzyl esterase
MQVKIDTGMLLGRFQENVAEFLGIPFAAAPVDDLRFQPPAAVNPWSGVRNALEYGPSPIQPGSFATGGKQLGSEDCLYLNLWASTPYKKGKPVIVWIYGGGFEGGSASSDEFNGQQLAAKADAVFINFNYRVGLLGFGALPQSEAYPSSTNLGLRDAIAALEWVHRNVELFGGDPDNVTVIGHSAGSFMASALLSNLKAQGLFARLVLLSGPTSRFIPLERTLALTSQALNLALNDDSTPKEVSVEKLFEAQSRFVPSDLAIRNGRIPQAMGLTLDAEYPDSVIPDHPLDIVMASNQTAKPILVGSAERETWIFRKFSPEYFEVANLNQLLEQMCSWGIPQEKSGIIAGAYQAKYVGVELPELRERMLSDYIYRLPAARLLEAQAEVPGKCWGLEFVGTKDAPMSHGFEVPALFEGTAKLRNVTPDPDFRQEFQTAIVNFVTSGDPGWEAYGDKHKSVKLMGKKSELVPFYYEELLQIWSGVERP